MRSLNMQTVLDGRADCFGEQLFKLIFKADLDNLRLLALGFPVEVRMVELYRHGPCPQKINGVTDFEALEALAESQTCSIESQVRPQERDIT